MQTQLKSESTEIECEVFSCSCYTHKLQVTADYEDEQFYCSIWTQGHQPVGWLLRIKHIWKIIRTGTPFDDQLCLTREDGRKLSSFIFHSINKMPRQFNNDKSFNFMKKIDEHERKEIKRQEKK